VSEIVLELAVGDILQIGARQLTVISVEASEVTFRIDDIERESDSEGNDSGRYDRKIGFGCGQLHFDRGGEKETGRAQVRTPSVYLEPGTIAPGLVQSEGDLPPNRSDWTSPASFQPHSRNISETTFPRRPR